MRCLSCQLSKKKFRDQKPHPLLGDNMEEVPGWKIIQVINEKLKPEEIYVYAFWLSSVIGKLYHKILAIRLPRRLPYTKLNHRQVPAKRLPAWCKRMY